VPAMSFWQSGMSREPTIGLAISRLHCTLQCGETDTRCHKDNLRMVVKLFDIIDIITANYSISFQIPSPRASSLIHVDHVVTTTSNPFGKQTFSNGQSESEAAASTAVAATRPFRRCKSSSTH
jgi:hypothetical protein